MEHEPEYEVPFSAYSNYFYDLARSIDGRYGVGDSLLPSLMEATLSTSACRRIQRRQQLESNHQRDLDRALRRTWATLNTAHIQVTDPDFYFEEFNAWLPAQLYYACYHAIRAFAVASAQQAPTDHRPALQMIGTAVQRGLFPYPWSAYCTGCPQIHTTEFAGLVAPRPVHVLSSPDPTTSPDRLAMLLRTTRTKELERRFKETRAKNVSVGKTRRNLSRETKASFAANLGPTTLFDVLWRVRLKANYQDADVFVIGALDQESAYGLASDLFVVANATVAVIEAIITAYVGMPVLARLSREYQARAPYRVGSPLAERAALWTSTDAFTSRPVVHLS